MSSQESHGLLPHQRATDSSTSSTEAPASSNANETPSPSAESVDSSTVVLNRPQDIYPGSGESLTTESTSRLITSNNDSSEPRHCWICLQDEGEDEEQRCWRSPCPCNLRAHEDCLLEWIADLEAPSRKAPIPTQILCPQCKAEIYIARPHDYLVSAIDFVGRNARSLVLPLGLSTTFGILYSGSMVHGMNSINLVFGLEDSRRIWQEGLQSMHVPKYLEKIFRLTDPFLFIVPSWKILVGVPSIAPALILSRTSLADHMFSALPILYFAWHRDGLFLRQWPPSPGLAFSLLPYFRAAYREIYSHTFGGLERQWEQAVQRKPREGETAEQVAAAQREAMDDNVINIEIDIEVDGGMEMGARAPELPPHVQEAVREHVVQHIQAEEHDANAEAANLENAGAVQRQNLHEQGPAVVEAQVQGAPNPGQHPANPGQLALVDNAFGREGISINKVAQSILGALFLPAISGVMGDILKIALPTSMVTKPIFRNGVYGTGKATGLLQERWGRSLVGGVLFVVIKDALVLYSKWKKAKNHGKRRVVDYVSSPGVRRR